MSIRYGIIGCNGVATEHANGVETTTGTDLVACADLDAVIADEFGSEHDCRWYTDHIEMIDDAALDAVSICTPSGTHAEIAIGAAEAGANVLCEKPLDIYADSVDRMIDAATANNVTLGGVFQRRTHPSARRAKAAVSDDELGEMVVGDVQVKWHRTQGYYESSEWRGTREMDGGCLMNQAIHGIDLLQWLMGGVERVNAICKTEARDVDVETVAVIVVEFENGAHGTIEASTITYPEQPVLVELNGQDGSVVLEDDNITQFETRDGEVDTHTEHIEHGDGHAMIVQDFVDAIREGREPMVPPEEARKAVDIILAAYESAAEGGWIEVESV